MYWNRIFWCSSGRRQIYTGDAVLEYMLDLAEETRRPAEPLDARCAGAEKGGAGACLIAQRDFVTPDDVQAVFNAVVAHRIGAGEAETHQLMQQVSIA